ncbi:MAG: hypothetical protein WCT04_09915 [Planctomycetota bacterium]
MLISFQCTQCGQIVHAPENATGKKGRCRYCNAVQEVPLRQNSIQEHSQAPQLSHDNSHNNEYIDSEEPREILVAQSHASNALATDNRIPCPYCSELILITAIKCKHCNEFIDGRNTNNLAHNQGYGYLQPQALAPQQNVNVVVNNQIGGGQKEQRWSAGVAMVLSFLIPGLGQMYKGQLLNGLAWFVIVVIGYIILFVPGLILHLFCIAGAGMGDTTR